MSPVSTSIPSPRRLRLFVYGTLRTDGPYHGRFCAGAISVERASVPGRIRLLPAGYPMLIVPAERILARGTADASADADTQARMERSLPLDAPARDSGGAEESARIPGEILTFDDDPARRLPPIDEYEGFHAGAPSLYRRVLLAVYTEHGSRPLAAWTYVGDPCP